MGYAKNGVQLAHRLEGKRKHHCSIFGVFGLAGEPFFNALCANWRADLPRRLLIDARQRGQRDQEAVLYARFDMADNSNIPTA
jgi:hypothetical protein